MSFPIEKLKGQSGRSMVEMLGVLAIIGILSITGILGYRYAMDKHAANVLVNDVKVEAVNTSAQVLGKNIDLYPSSDQTTAGYPIDVDYEVPGNFDYFVVSVSRVPVKICNMITQTGWGESLIDMYTGLTSGSGMNCTGQDDVVTIRFVFDAELAGSMADRADDADVEACETAGDCTDTGCGVSCVDGMCVGACSASREVCATQSGGTKACCDPNKVIGGYCCPSVVDGQCCDSQGNCCPPTEPLRDYYGNCHSCNESDPVYVYENLATCNLCSNNRSLKGNYCNLKCPADKPLQDDSGECYACDDPRDVSVDGVASNCATACGSARYVFTRTDTVNYYFPDIKLCGLTTCSGDKPLRSSWAGECYSCDEEYGISLADSTKCEELCGEKRELVGSVCHLKCTPEKPIRGKDGICYACDEDTAFQLDRSDGEKCANQCSGLREFVTGYCQLVCPADRPLRHSHDHKCHACSTTDQVAGVTAEECVSKCGDLREFVNGYCVLKECPANSFRTRTSCYSCEASLAIPIDSITDGCENICGGTWGIDASRGGGTVYCVQKICEGTARPLQDSSGRCHACDEESRITVSSQSGNCESACGSSRELVRSNLCFIKCPTDRPLRNFTTGTCHRCDDVENIVTYSDSDCTSVCPNRAVVGFAQYSEGKICSNTKICPENKPLRGSDGDCYACDYDGGIFLADRSSCSVICPNREMDNWYSGACLIKCPAGKPIRNGDTLASCKSCNSSEPIYVSDETTCITKCPDRRWYADWEACVPEDWTE